MRILQNIAHIIQQRDNRLDVIWLPSSVYQPLNGAMRIGRRGSNAGQFQLGLVGHNVQQPPPLGLNLVQAKVPAILLGNNELYTQIEEAIRNTFGVGARPAMPPPVFKSLYPANVDLEYPHQANWKIPKFDKFPGDETENAVEHITRFTAQCREAVADSFLKLWLLNMSLMKTTFTR